MRIIKQQILNQQDNQTSITQQANTIPPATIQQMVLLKASLSFWSYRQLKRINYKKNTPFAVPT